MTWTVKEPFLLVMITGKAAEKEIPLLGIFQVGSYEQQWRPGRHRTLMGKRMGWFSASLQILLLLCALCVKCTAVGNTSSFLSIDCGGSGEYTDDFGIDWVPDDKYIKSGETITIGQFPLLRSRQHNRIFPDGRSKHCYVLPLTVGATYQLRVILLHNGVADIPLPVDFNVTVNSNPWFKWSLSPSAANVINTPIVFDSVFLSESNEVYLCLLKGTQSIPYITSIELRELNPVSYSVVREGQFLANLYRNNDGPNRVITQFPDDDFDRYWFPDTLRMAKYASLVNASALPDPFPKPALGYNMPPAKVMMDAFTAPKITDRYDFFTATDRVFVALYFQELRSNYSAADPRGVIITVADDIPYQLNISDRVHEIIFNVYNVTDDGVNITIEKQEWSSYDPILNALEIYRVADINLSAIDPADVTPIQSIQASFNLTDWTGDPCYPVPWDWIACDPATSRVVTLNLSRMSLSGEIPPEIDGLKSLEVLDLDNNDLTGSIPSSMVTDLPRLRILKLDNNNLSGYIPIPFQNRNGFTFTGNPRLVLCLPGDKCNTSSKGTKSSKVGIIIGVIVGAIFAIFIALCVIACCYRKYGKKNVSGLPAKSAAAQPLHSRSREISGQSGEEFHNSDTWSSTPGQGSAGGANSSDFMPAGYITIDQIIAATQNYKKRIGKGGFGDVFYGKLPNGREVAVKVNTEGAHQGRAEFLNEVALLTIVHHRNLVPLLGYCDEADQRILVYEFQSNGALNDLLYGPHAAARPLDWKTRLSIALDAAKGLEYLHTGCSPKIIHRDVKSNNILIGDNFVGKVSDFGISKSSPDDDNTFSTLVRGSPGYLDPEYFDNQKLTPKSDVYSFGVVLMEIMRGTSPVFSREIGIHELLVDQMKSAMATGDILSFTDPRLEQKFNPESVWAMAELALQSVDKKAVNRPDMSQVVRSLGEAIKLEISYDAGGVNAPITGSFNMSGRDSSYRGFTSEFPTHVFHGHFEEATNVSSVRNVEEIMNMRSPERAAKATGDTGTSVLWQPPTI